MTSKKKFNELQSQLKLETQILDAEFVYSRSLFTSNCDLEGECRDLRNYLDATEARYQEACNVNGALEESLSNEVELSEKYRNAGLEAVDLARYVIGVGKALTATWEKSRQELAAAREAIDYLKGEALLDRNANRALGEALKAATHDLMEATSVVAEQDRALADIHALSVHISCAP